MIFWNGFVIFHYFLTLFKGFLKCFLKNMDCRIRLTNDNPYNESFEMKHSKLEVMEEWA
jgi:hypothetical protein